MRLHLLQMNLAWEDRQANCARAAAMATEAGVAPGALVLLPEMFDSGFSLNVERTADADGATANFLSGLAARLRATVLAGTTANGPDGRGRNRALAFGPDGAEIARYDKLHPFSFGREPERFSGGDRITTFPWNSLTACPAVCYDLRFPELFRAGLAMGADLYCVIANWPAARAAHWRALLIARAVENQAPVAGVNRCGSDPHLAYKGGSIIVGPRGDILAEAGESEQILTAEIDPAAIESWRSEFPAWSDLRPELAPGIDVSGRLKAVSGRPAGAASPATGPRKKKTQPTPPTRHRRVD